MLVVQDKSSRFDAEFGVELYMERVDVDADDGDLGIEPEHMRSLAIDASAAEAEIGLGTGDDLSDRAHLLHSPISHASGAASQREAGVLFSTKPLM